MITLSKSRIVAHLQCPKRLWLYVHKPEVLSDSTLTQARFAAGNDVGHEARNIYDPEGCGRTVDITEVGIRAGIDLTKSLLTERLPVFEAGFAGHGALAFADVLLPADQDGLGWRMVEVKSSTSVKQYHVQDLAIQTLVARTSGLQLSSIAVAHVDSSWKYPGENDYRGLLKEVDLTEQVGRLEGDVTTWISDAQVTVASSDEPNIPMGAQCTDPVECGFQTYCRSMCVPAEFPVAWLPGALSKEAKKHCSDPIQTDMRAIPAEFLNTLQKRVRNSTVAGKSYFDAVGAKAALADYPLPAYFLDFETIQFAVPIWAGTRPYAQIPFQFSLHRLEADGILRHSQFLITDGQDPSRRFSEQLVNDCGDCGPIFVYNASFESSRIRELADRFDDLAEHLQALNVRIVDLHPITKKHFYDPRQQGSWSIKLVLRAIDPCLAYENLMGIQDGGMAQTEYMRAIEPRTSQSETDRIQRELLAYCRHDTYALVRLWQLLSGRKEFNL